MNTKTKRTYFTKADLFDFGLFLESDYRRNLLQKRAAHWQKEKTIAYQPWTALVRHVSEQEYKDWLEYKELLSDT